MRDKIKLCTAFCVNCKGLLLLMIAALTPSIAAHWQAQLSIGCDSTKNALSTSNRRCSFIFYKALICRNMKGNAFVTFCVRFYTNIECDLLIEWLKNQSAIIYYLRTFKKKCEMKEKKTLITIVCFSFLFHFVLHAHYKRLKCFKYDPLNFMA